MTADKNAILDAKLRSAVALHTQGHFARAQELYDDILRTHPRHFDALHLSGVIAAATANPRKALEFIGKAVAIRPDSAIACNNHGGALYELGEWEAALRSYDRAALLANGYADPLYNRGNVLKDLGRWEEAVASYDRAIAVRSGYAEAHCNRGICFAAMNRVELALASYDRAIALRAGYAEAYYNRGNSLCLQRLWSEALDSFDRAIDRKRDYAEAFANRTVALKELSRFDEALASSERAIELSPNLAAAHSNRAGVLLARNHIDAALDSYDRAIAIAPDCPATRVNRGLARLLRGELEGGWADYEWRWSDRTRWVFEERRQFTQPRWTGDQSLAGRTILLHSEQGYGDTIQFCRYVQLLAELGARVILEVPPALSALLQSLRGVTQVVVRGEALPEFEFYCPLLSVPLALRTTLESVPSSIPYLHADEATWDRWHERLGEAHCPRVGLAWSGAFRPELPDLWAVNERRNIPLGQLAKLERIGVEFYSLQMGPLAKSDIAEQARREKGLRVIDMTDHIKSFADTAALIEQLDLVISVDTSTAHLAGALAKPVWILNRFDTCWRWLLDRVDSPWYPTARLYRQPSAGDWGTVVDRVSTDLTGFFAPRDEFGGCG